MLENEITERADLEGVPTKSARVVLLGTFAKVLGIQFHIDGFPFGARKRSQRGVSGSTGS